MTPNQVRARLIERDTNFRQWAIANNYDPRMVTHAVTRWAGADDQPRGRLTFRILRELSHFIDQEILPGLLDEQQEA